LPHSVKQKNPKADDRIKNPSQKQERSSLDSVHIPGGNARAKSWPGGRRRR